MNVNVAPCLLSVSRDKGFLKRNRVLLCQMFSACSPTPKWPNKIIESSITFTVNVSNDITIYNTFILSNKGVQQQPLVPWLLSLHTIDIYLMAIQDSA